jgi:hypothetical protein
MSEMIESQIKLVKDAIKSLKGESIMDDRAFSYMLLNIVFKQNYADCIVTDGPNDGGIDFIFYNDDESKLILGQSKYTASLDANAVIAEFNKMFSTYQNFKKQNTGIYNEALKKELTNAMDQMPDDNSGTVEYHLYTKAESFDVEAVAIRMEQTMPDDFPIDSAKVFDKAEIENAIEASQQNIDIVSEGSILIDKPKNYLSYESNSLEGIMCNVKSSSIVKLYNLYQNSGLFDLNIRRFIKNKLVDDAIKKTLDKDRINFWFLNNGIIIACEDYSIDGYKITLSNFSIVNGGQTTQLIGEYKGKATEDFVIPCKIVAVKDNKTAPELFNKIAQASNSQKPILPRDLRANSKEMVALAHWLKDENIFLEIKRGTADKKTKAKFKYSLKNDELGQLLLSFVHQQPGTSRSGKKTIFDNAEYYGKLFRVNYQKDSNKKTFIIDLIDLKAKYDALDAAFKDPNDKDHYLRSEEMEILQNGRQTIIALLGLCYRLVNQQITKEQLAGGQNALSIDNFAYGPILSNYKKDDLDQKFEAIVTTLITILYELYDKAYRSGLTSSVSNFMKTDSKYYEQVVKEFVVYFRYQAGQNIQANWDIFKQS